MTRADKIYKLWRQHYTYSEMAEELNVSKETIRTEMLKLPWEKPCKHCGRIFTADRRTQKFCSRKCTRSYSYYQTAKEAKAAEKKKAYKPKVSIDEVCRLAKEKGLSYGQYVKLYG